MNLKFSFIFSVLFISYANCMDQSVLEFSIQNATNVTFKSVQIKTSNSFNGISKHPIKSGNEVKFKIPNKTNEPIFVAINIFLSVPTYQTTTKSFSDKIPEFIIQIFGNTTIKLCVYQEVFGIERQFVIFNQMSQVVNVSIVTSLIGFDSQGPIFYLMKPNINTSVLIFIPLIKADFRLGEKNTVQVGQYFYQGGPTAGTPILTSYPLHGDSFELVIKS